jgi:septum formation protein
VIVSDVDESLIAGEAASSMVERLALKKAWVVAQQHRNAWTVGADTTVVLNGEILGKPESEAEARSILAKLSGVTHEVVGAFALVAPSRAVEVVQVHRSRVRMIPIGAELIEAYVKTGEPMDKAGAYAVQGIGASFIADVQGSYTNVVGLNLQALVDVLLKNGALACISHQLRREEA